jgi:hypothetical protein
VKSRICVLTWTLVALGLGGCGTGMGTPSLLAPGPAREQRARAHRFDPYPEMESGPALVGARPREFDRPLTEPVRTQFEQWGYGRSQAGP